MLDPMAGSGTVLAVAQKMGHRAYGFDTDPLAVLTARTWTTMIHLEEVSSSAADVLQGARKIFDNVSLREAYPEDADNETRSFIRYWFDGRARRELTSLSCAIRKVRNEEVRNILWCAFSRLIITKQGGASRAMDLSHSRPHRVFKRARMMPFDGFLIAVGRVARNCLSASENEKLISASVERVDARYLPLKSDSIDLVITSPPYLNAIDYIRCSKFSLVWMGYGIQSLRTIRSNNIGTEIKMVSGFKTKVILDAMGKMGDLSALPERYQGIIERYLHDMYRVLSEIRRVVRPGGFGVLVIGNSSLRGTFVNNASGLRLLGESVELIPVSRVTRRLPANRRYLPPPSVKASGPELASRLRTETVLTFQAPY
ncbi:MAG: hypothetical protein IH856_21860 [Deltaproteobacteria bacterium]|nr:hypothetical protein [Deltaproteobacteria bacterium]